MILGFAVSAATACAIVAQNSEIMRSLVGMLIGLMSSVFGIFISPRSIPRPDSGGVHCQRGVTNREKRLVERGGFVTISIGPHARRRGADSTPRSGPLEKAARWLGLFAAVPKPAGDFGVRGICRGYAFRREPLKKNPVAQSLRRRRRSNSLSLTSCSSPPSRDNLKSVLGAQRMAAGNRRPTLLNSTRILQRVQLPRSLRSQ